MEIIKILVSVKKFTWGYTESCKLNNDTKEYSLLTIISKEKETIFILKENFYLFKDIAVGVRYKMELYPLQDGFYKFSRIITDHPLYTKAKDQYHKQNFKLAVDYFKQYFSVLNLDFQDSSSLDFYASHLREYKNCLINYYNFKIYQNDSELDKNSLYNRVKEALIADLKYDSEEHYFYLIYNYSFHPNIVFKDSETDEEYDIKDFLKRDPEKLFKLIIECDRIFICEYFFLHGDYYSVPNFREALELNFLKRYIIEEHRLIKTPAREFYYDDSDILDGFGGDIDACNDHYL